MKRREFSLSAATAVAASAVTLPMATPLWRKCASSRRARTSKALQARRDRSGCRQDRSHRVLLVQLPPLQRL